jgi:hypothetical protein
MQTALDVLTRALQGDAGAQSFLEQTCNIYVLDVAGTTMITKSRIDTSMEDILKDHPQHTLPKLYGCWNFLHQALNEMDQRLHNNSSNNNNHNQDTFAMESSFIIQQQLQVLLLLAQVAVKVARRSNVADRQLVLTCLENHYGHPHHNNNNNKNYRSIAQQLVEENAQLRDIVMGRIAAFALDPSSLQRQRLQQDAFHAAVAVLSTFHQAMAAHAISNHNVQHLLLDWMIPSSQQLPSYSLACIVMNIAEEATSAIPVKGGSTSSPSLLPTLQQLSMPVVTQLLGPVLQLCIQNQPQHDDDDDDDDQDDDNHNINHMMITTTVVTALQALQAWCTVTDLSIAQVQHLCTSKVRVSIFIEVFSV